MKKFRFFTFILAGVLALAIQNANAGSVVVSDGHGHIEACYGHPLEIAKAKALADAHTRGWAQVKFLNSSAVTGYGAIVVARHPNGYGTMTAVSLGNPSKKVAVSLARDRCLQAGGTDPKVKYTFKG